MTEKEVLESPNPSLPGETRQSGVSLGLGPPGVGSWEATTALGECLN